MVLIDVYPFFLRHTAGEAPTVWIDVYHVINELYRNVFIDRLALDKKQWYILTLLLFLNCISYMCS
jgi:hypothetical protein